MFPLRLKVFPLGGYLFLLFILYLAGVYLGGLNFFLFVLLLSLPLASFLHLLITTLFIRVNQEFSTTHPVKGRNVTYTLTVALESWLPGTWITVRYKKIGKELTGQLPDTSFFPERGRPFKKTHTILCPFRGVYTLGVECIEVHDLLNWVSIRLKAGHRTFYVYPRLIQLQRVKLDQGGDIFRTGGEYRGEITDYSLTEMLKEYREGESIRHMAWKKFAATGRAFVRVYEQTSWPGITIYLDTRRKGEMNYRILEAEDCSVEILVALVDYFVKKDVPVFLRTGQWGIQEFSPGSRKRVKPFIESTVGLFFRGESPWGVNPSELLRMDLEGNSLLTGYVLLISHLFDPATLSFLLDPKPAGIKTAGVLNLTSTSEEVKAKASSLFSSAQGRDSRFFIVSSSDSIREDLS